jgi:glycosyltransferase involved in cell wall biosynthesis
MTSLVIPAFNAQDSLAACLEALSRQTTIPDEVIVVDDGSTDATAETATRYAARLVRQTNQGPAIARNEGVRHAHGDFLLFTDADCEPARDWVAEMVAPFSDPTVVGVKGIYRTRQVERIARLAQCEFEERYERLAGYERIDLVDTYSAAFTLAAFRAAGGFPAGFSEANNEDVELSYRLARAGHKLVFNPRAVVYHRHKASWGAYFRLKMRRGHWRMVVYRLHPAKAVNDTYTPQVLKLQVLLTLVAAAGALATIRRPWCAFVPMACLVALSVSAVPFGRVVWRKDRPLVPWVLPFVAVRAAAFAIGILSGVVAGLRYRRPAAAASA